MLKIYSIHKHGDAKEEYILLKATEKVNIGDYAVIDRTFNKDGKVSNIHKHFFRFPSKVIEKGEFVVLRTGKGTPSIGKMTGGEAAHIYYWGSEAPFWNDSNTEQAELLKIAVVDKKAAA